MIAKPKPPRCKAILRRSGLNAECRAWAQRGSYFCAAHDPEKAGDRAAARLVARSWLGEAEIKWDDDRVESLARALVRFADRARENMRRNG